MSNELDLTDIIERARKSAGSGTEQAAKKNFAERLSRELAQEVANRLRRKFPGITPTEDGKGHERRTKSAKGMKRLDVNYSTQDLGLGVGVSIKTVTALDGKSKRYTKNYTRIDNELRAEAKDYHQRQPYAVMIALIFLPEDACGDGSDRTPSSFGAAVRCFRYRANRRNPTNEEELFERVFVACYRVGRPGRTPGATWFFDVMRAPPKRGLPVQKDRLNIGDVIEEIERTFQNRSDPPFEWADHYEEFR